MYKSYAHNLFEFLSLNSYDKNVKLCIYPVHIIIVSNYLYYPFLKVTLFPLTSVSKGSC